MSNEKMALIGGAMLPLVGSLFEHLNLFHLAPAIIVPVFLVTVASKDIVEAWKSGDISWTGVPQNQEGRIHFELMFKRFRSFVLGAFLGMFILIIIKIMAPT